MLGRQKGIGQKRAASKQKGCQVQSPRGHGESQELKMSSSSRSILVLRGIAFMKSEGVFFDQKL